MGSRKDKQVYFFGRRPIGGSLLRTFLQSQHASLTCFTRPPACRSRLARRPCDVLIVDLAGPAAQALALIAQARGMVPRIATVALVARGDVPGTVAAMRVGACECLEKPVAAEGFREALRVRLDPSARSITDGILTAREEQVLQGILAGQTSREIAAQSRCSPRTVEKHRQNILRKLKARRVVDLFRYAFVQ